MPANSSTQLSYEVFVSDGPVLARDQRMPNGDRLVWNPLASTLVFGEQDALLVDPPFTRAQIQQVGDWVERSGKRLTSIYATHGHGDHWFGTGGTSPRASRTSPCTPPRAPSRSCSSKPPRAARSMWDRSSPGLIPPTPVLAQPFPRAGSALEGNCRTPSTPATPTPTRPPCCTCHRLVWSSPGDAVYNGVHQYVFEGGDGGLTRWLRGLDPIAALQPRAVVAGAQEPRAP